MQSPAFRSLLFAGAALLIACDGGTTGTDSGQAQPDTEATTYAVPIPVPIPALPEVEPEPELGPELGEFEITYYWMAEAGEKPEAELTQTLYSHKGCQKVAQVTPRFARRLVMEGTGKLPDGRVINTSGVPCDCPSKPCFFEVKKYKKWGVGVGKKPLSPFRTVAVDPAHIPIGTKLFVPELAGKTMPGRKPWGGFVHDGCVVAGDRGGGVSGTQIDLFMGRERHYRAFYRRHRILAATIYDGKGRCDGDKDEPAATGRDSM